MSLLPPQRHALVIGGTGFISQYAVEELATAGYTVSIVTRGSTPDLHGELIASRLKINCNKRKEFVTSLRNSLQTIAQDQHLTNVPSAWDIVVDFICFDGDHANDIVEGLSGICKIFVQISTDSIYEVCKRPTDKCYETCYGRTEQWAELLDIPESKLLEKDDYGYNKFICEKIFRDNVSRLPFVALRLPDVLGEREWPRSRHNQYQTRVQLGLPVYVNPAKHLPSNGSEKKISFVYAGDVARAVVACGRALQEAEQEENSLTESTVKRDRFHALIGCGINIGSIESITLRQYIHFIGKVLGVPAFPFISHSERVKAFQAAREYRKQLFAPFFKSQKNNSSELTYSAINSLACSYSFMSRLILKKFGLSLTPKDISLPLVLQTVKSRTFNPDGFFINETPTASSPKYWEDIDAEFKLPTLQEPIIWKRDNPSFFVSLLQERDVELSSDSDSSSNSSSESSSSELSDLEFDETSSQAGIMRFVESKLENAEINEEDDMFSYLPSVDEGHIDTRAAETLLPEYTNSDVWAFLRRMIIWYSHQDVMKYMEADAMKLLRREVLRNQLKYQLKSKTNKKQKA